MKVLRWLVPVLLASCSGVYDVQVPFGEGSADELAKVAEDLSPEQLSDLDDWRRRVAVQSVIDSDPVPSVTVREALEQQSKWKADVSRAEVERAAAEEAEKAERAKRIEILNAAVDVLLVSKEYIPPDYERMSADDWINIGCVVSNKTEKEVAGVKGSLKIVDMFGGEIFTSVLSIEEVIPPLGKVKWMGALDYNQFNKEHQRLRAADLRKIKSFWSAEQIIFSDGSSFQ